MAASIYDILSLKQFGLGSLNALVDSVWTGGAVTGFGHDLQQSDLARFAGQTYLGISVADLPRVTGPIMVTGREAWSAANGRAIAGTAGADVVLWLSGPAIVDAGAGNDVVATGGGDDLVFGGAGNDSIATGRGNDILFGGDGVDILNAGDGDDLLKGDVGNDMLNGGNGHDVLDGGAGDDMMTGGAGDDTYYVDSRFDRVTELANGGTDSIIASVSYSLLNTQVENLQITGNAAYAYGNGLNNLLTGNDGNNLLVGYGGEDTMAGGAGNDTYTVDSAGDRVLETAGNGIDSIEAYVSFDLSTTPAVENLRLYGTAATARGNALDNLLAGSNGANTLQGLDGNDRLDGLGGNDLLVGGDGMDIFAYGARGGADRVADFIDGQDQVLVYGLGIGSFAALQPLMRQQGADVLIDFGGGNRLLLEQVGLGSLSAADFLFG